MGSEDGVMAKESKAPWSIKEKMSAIIIAALIVLASVIAAVSVIDRLERGVEFTVRTDKEQYVLGEHICINVEYVNNGYDTVDLTFGSSCVASFYVFDSDGSPVCPIIQMALWWMVYEELEPGETLSGGCGWDQTDDMGEIMLSLGTFIISAHSLCSELQLSASTTISIMG